VARFRPPDRPAEAMRSTTAPKVRTALAMVTTTLVVTVSSASAHEIVPGLRGFPSLLLHPFVAMEMVLIMVGLALVAGASASRIPLAAGMVAVMLGSFAGALAQPSALTVPGLWRGPLVLAVGLGALAATGRSLGRGTLLSLGLAAAIAISLGVPPERAGWVGKVEVAGAAAVAIVVTLLALALPRAKFSDHAPVRIAGRIAGAWCIAIASLGLAAALR
jgi:hypothetical protein